MICTLCGTDVAETEAAAVAMKIEAATTPGQWESWTGKREGETWDISVPPRSVYQVTMVAKSTMKEINANTYGEDYSQGSEFKVFVIVSINGHLFRKDGTADSYGSESWSGPLRPVRVGTRLVKVFEDVTP